MRVARDVPESRAPALRYAGGIVAIQMFWIARLTITGMVAATTLVLLGLAEMLLPVSGHLTPTGGPVAVGTGSYVAQDA